MGIDAASMALLSGAKRMGVDFSSTAMIGRQNFAGSGVLRGLKRLFETQRIQENARTFLAENFFCEKLFERLGAREVESFDVSDYQKATHLHDMNQPIPERFHGRYSCVHDGGTIEHVFNIPQALKNCLQMVRLGGHFLQVNEANNFMGHGFWQLSPEMIFRAMSPENGYETRAVLLHEVAPGGSWHLAADPEKVRARVELRNRRPTYILTIARRVEIKEIFATPPQQSDYVVNWSRKRDGTPRPKAPKRPLMERVTGRLQRDAAALPGGIARLIYGPPIYDPKHYRLLREEQVWQGDLHP